MNTTDALTIFADALKALGIDPHEVEVTLPLGPWRMLNQALAREETVGLFAGVAVENRIEVGGVRYLVRFGEG